MLLIKYFISEFDPGNDISHKNSTVTSNCANVNSTTATENLRHVKQSTHRMPQSIQQICNEPSTSPCTKISTDSTIDSTFTADSSEQCETENVFKKPTSATKRKLITESCMMRKRSCQTKIIATSKSPQLDKPTKSILDKNSSFVGCVTPSDRTKQSTSIVDEPDPLLVQDILRYFKMPKFIEPITDSDFVLAASKRLSEVDTVNFNLDSEMVSIDLESTDLVSTDLASTDLASTDFESTSLIERELVTYDEIESPASPPPFNSSASPHHAPLIIPIEPKKLIRSVVKDILANFDGHKRLSLSRRKYKVPSVEEEQLLASTRYRIETYVMSAWTENDIDVCCNDLSNIRPSILSKCIIEVVMNTKCENLSREFTPPAPALPKCHQQIIVLIKRISRHVNSFEDLVLFQLEKTMFALAGEKVSIIEGLNLTHLFIGLTDCIDERSKWSCVLFVYKCFYYFAIKAIPMIYSVLMAYPTILPKFEDSENVADFLMNTTNILQATFAIVLINTNLCEPDSVLKNNGLKKKDLSTFLKTYYHFPYGKPTTNDFVDNLVNRLNNGTNLENISYSLILIAKRNGTDWADDMIQKKLLPLLNNFLLTVRNGADENDERIAILVSAISSIIKTFPITKDISNYQQIFCKILDLTARRCIQEEAVMALLRTSRFGMVNVYKRIVDWQPVYAVSRNCYSMLCTFLYRQNLSYWKQL